MTIYKVKVEQPESPIEYGDKIMDETVNPMGIFEIAENKNGIITSKLLETSFNSNEDIIISKPKKWSMISGRSNTYMQPFNVKSNISDKEYNITGIVTYTIASPKDIIVEIEY